MVDRVPGDDRNILLRRPPPRAERQTRLAIASRVVDAVVVQDTEAFLAAVAAWGSRRRDVHFAVLVGSHARAEDRADEWSDIDLVIVADDPAAMIADAAWLEELGRPMLSFVEPSAVGGLTERRVLFESGQDVDFVLLPVAGAAELATSAEAASVFARGFWVLVDKLGIAPVLDAQAGAPPTPDLPDAAAFAQLTHDFWFHALWSAKKLRRGELWIAKQGCDCYLKALTVRLLAWHAQAADRSVDTWHRGRFLERWADPAALRDFRAAFALCDPDDVARALWATVDLFERLERETAKRLGLATRVPHAEIRDQLRALLG
jgi:aminoglycoside 6-adenylyltransferase